MQIFGYQRSGNHLLMASVWLNFNVPTSSTSMAYIPHPNGITTSPTCQWDGHLMPIIPWTAVAGTHSPYLRQDPRTSVYIYRKSFESVYKSKGLLYGRSIEAKYESQLWEDHVNGWKRSGAYLVCYEDLVADFETTMDKLGARFDLKRFGNTWVKPPKLGWTSEAPRDDFRVYFYGRHPVYLCSPDRDELITFIVNEQKRDIYGIGKIDIKPEDTVIDAGANIGDFAIHAALRYGCKVISIEPSSVVYEYLVRNIEKNGLGHLITPIHAGLNADGKPIELRHYGGQRFKNCGSLGNGIFNVDVVESIETCPAVTLADVCKVPIKLLKMDIEGAEYQLIDRMPSNVEHCSLELHKNMGDWQTALKKLRARFNSKLVVMS